MITMQFTKDVLSGEGKPSGFPFAKFNLSVKDNNSTYTTQQLGDFRECSETESLDPKIDSGDLYFIQPDWETQEYESG